MSAPEQRKKVSGTPGIGGKKPSWLTLPLSPYPHPTFSPLRHTDFQPSIRTSSLVLNLTSSAKGEKLLHDSTSSISGTVYMYRGVISKRSPTVRRFSPRPRGSCRATAQKVRGARARRRGAARRLSVSCPSVFGSPWNGQRCARFARVERSVQLPI